MLKFTVSVPRITAEDFEQLVKIQPKLDYYVDSLIVDSVELAESYTTAKAEKNLVRGEYIAFKSTKLNEEGTYWVTDFTIYGD